MSKYLSLPTLLACLALAAVSAGAAEPPAGKALLSALHAAEAELSTGYTLAVEVRTPAHPFDPAQGIEVRKGRLSHDGETVALETTSTYDRRPLYRRLGEADYQQLDFDGESNLLLWRHRAKVGLRAAGVNASLSEVTLLRISPGGQVLERTEHTQLFRFPLGSRDNLPEVPQILMALGSGFSEHLDEVREVRAAGDTSLELRADGSFGRTLLGEWRLTMEREADVVRAATFTRAGATQPLVEVWTEGTLESGGLVLAQRGRVRHLLRAPATFFEISVSATQLSPKADRSLIGRARRQVDSKLPRGAEIIDYNTTPPSRRSLN